MDFGGRTTHVKPFAIVEMHDRPLCQYEAIDLMSLLVDSSKSRKILIVTAWLAEAAVDNTYYCWSCGHVVHAKNDCPSKQRQPKP